MTSAFFGLCCLLAPASAAWGKKSGDGDATGSSQADLAAQVQELSKAVQAQTSRIAKLESQLAAQKKAAQVKQQCASSSAPSTGFDLQPELQPFRLAEAQRALQRQREQITSLYSAAVGTPLTLALDTDAGLLFVSVGGVIVQPSATLGATRPLPPYARETVRSRLCVFL